MFWIAAIAISALLIKLGALSVAFVVLATALKIALIVIVLLAGLLLWRWYRNRSWRHI